MKIAIMQPYFFPYLGYFSLIKHTDSFILLDAVQFIRHGWIERNRVLKQNEGWLYIKVPILKEDRETIICDIAIDNSQNWKDKILAQLNPYKKTAPFYYPVIKMLNEIFKQDFDNIVKLNKISLESVCDYLNIDRKINVFSEMDLDIEKPTAPDEWALNICKALGDIDEYWNPPGGLSFFDRSKYEKSGIAIKFQQVNLKEYDQKRNVFEPGLSIIDLMMFNSADDINLMLDNFEIL